MGFTLVGAFPASHANLDAGLGVVHVGGAVVGIFAGDIAAIVAGRASDSAHPALTAPRAS